MFQKKLGAEISYMYPFVLTDESNLVEIPLKHSNSRYNILVNFYDETGRKHSFTNEVLSFHKW